MAYLQSLVPVTLASLTEKTSLQSSDIVPGAPSSGAIGKIQAQTLLAYVTAGEATQTTFAPGVITEEFGDLTVTTTFNGDGTITRVIGAPYSVSITTTFGDGTISEVVN